MRAVLSKAPEVISIDVGFRKLLRDCAATGGLLFTCWPDLLLGAQAGLVPRDGLSRRSVLPSLEEL